MKVERMILLYLCAYESTRAKNAQLACILIGSLSKSGGIVVLYNFLAYVPSIFLFLCLQYLATLWVNKTEYYVMCPMTLFENST